MTKAKTARQIAASKRNIVKAQIASARSRKGKKRSVAAGHHYGTGKTGRKNTRLALYGSRKHGISPAQYARRKQRANKWKKRALITGAVAAGTFHLVTQYTTPEEKVKIINKTRDYAHAAKTKVRYHASGLHSQIRRATRKK